MIYLIDDKTSRRVDYGWTDSRIENFSDILTPISDFEKLSVCMEEIHQAGGIVIFHESFINAVGDVRQNDISRWLKDIEKEHGVLIAYFSGSKRQRSITSNGKICNLPPDVLYTNLECFLQNYRRGEADFKYLLFGQNPDLENNLRKAISKVNNANMEQELQVSDKNLFFFLASEEALYPPFENVSIEDSFDFSCDDSSLCNIVAEKMGNDKFDGVFVPLCFGETLSDFLGLRFAMLIRLSDTPNRLSPIVIYGEARYADLLHNDCFDILKMPGVYYVGYDYKGIIGLASSLRDISDHEYSNGIRNLRLSIPTNIGDNHSVSNQWAIYRWAEMFDWNEHPKILSQSFLDSLYFKYLYARFGGHDKFKNKHKQSCEISGIAGKKIIYVDDEYNKGWKNILSAIFEQSGAEFVCYEGFRKDFTCEQQIESINAFVDENDADCYIIDLRLHEDDFKQTKNLSGHRVAKHIKEINEGNQIVVFSASNKIWNLKEQLDKIKALGYVLKESPDLNLNRENSRLLYDEFACLIKKACKLSYLRQLYTAQKELCHISSEAKRLDTTIRLLSLDNAEENQDLLGAVLLNEIVFVEDYVKKNKGYNAYSIDTDVYLANDNDKNFQQLLTGHMFFKREEIDGHSTVIDIDGFHEECTPAPNGWCEITKSDVTLISAALFIGFGMKLSDVKQYVQLKKLRNTQVAHGGNIKDIKAAMLVEFYHRVIYPMIKKN